ncbi:glycoside hydrolase family 16 protein, partial [Ceratobasidium sp. AG-I]
YVDLQTATSQGLAYLALEGQAFMPMDNTTVLSSGQPRKSVRVESYKRYGGGLLVLDIAKAPCGCCIKVGPNWPWSGEIAVFEGVNQNKRNQVTFHTDTGCTITNPQNFTGELLDSNYDATGSSGDAGCGLINDSAESFGAPFNAVGGGVLASLWGSSGICVWFFHRSTIPHDITQNTPNPDNWGEPTALLSNTSCPPQAHFWDHQIVLNIDICGTKSSLAGACPGTCSDQVMDPTNFDVSPNNLG